MGQALRGNAGAGGEGRPASQNRLNAFRRGLAGFLVAAAAFFFAAQNIPAQEVDAPVRIDSGRFTFVSYHSDSALARSLLAIALKGDTFPGLPRPAARALIAVAPDEGRFRAWIGQGVPEWGAAVAFPARNFVVMRGTRGGAKGGDPRVVLRHELAHLALHEFLGELPPRWFDEGYASYAAGEWKRDEALAANLFLVLRGRPSLDSLDAGFEAGSSVAQATYALAHVAVADLAALDRQRGLSLFFQYWREERNFERALRRAYGLTGSDFETRWKRNITRRYGVIAIATDLGIAVGVLIIVLAPLYLRRRKRARERMAALRLAEAESEKKLITEALRKLMGKGDE